MQNDINLPESSGELMKVGWSPIVIKQPQWKVKMNWNAGDMTTMSRLFIAIYLIMEEVSHPNRRLQVS